MGKSDLSGFSKGTWKDSKSEINLESFYIVCNNSFGDCYKRKSSS